MGNDRYQYHLATFSKLLRGRNPQGPIKPGTEARLIAKSVNFPADLEVLCDPNLFFVDKPAVMGIDSRRLSGGAF